MPLLKEFYFAGNSMNRNGQSPLYLLAGIIGALFAIYTLREEAPQIYYVIGAALLLTTAIYFKLIYFIALELILIAGHGAIFLGIGPVLQVVIPILLCVQLLIYYLLSGQLKNIYRLMGAIGIALLSIGFGYKSQWVFFFGSLLVAIYAIYQVYRGHKVALLWGILNMVFVLNAAFKIVF